MSAYAERRRALHLTQSLRWRELGSGASPAGDVGGDAQEGDAFSRHWVADLPNGLFARIEIAFYVQRSDDQEDAPALVIARQTEYLVCRDPDDAGSTELASETIYDQPHEWAESDPAEATAKLACESLYLHDVAWPDEPDRVLDVLSVGLPDVTDIGARRVDADVTRLWIGRVCIGTVTRVQLDTGDAYIAQVHDWENGLPVPLCSVLGEPADDYDPRHAGFFDDPAEAFTKVATEVPATLTRAVYDPAAAPVTEPGS